MVSSSFVTLFMLLAVAGPALSSDFVVKRTLAPRSHHSHHFRSSGHGGHHHNGHSHGHGQQLKAPTGISIKTDDKPSGSELPGPFLPHGKPSGKGLAGPILPTINNGTLPGSQPASCNNISQLVAGCPTGFGARTTGGGVATPVFPKTNDELKQYLNSPQPQVIVLTKEFNFIGTEGEASAPGCAPWGTAPECQVALELGKGWCDTYKKDAPKLKSISYDKAGVTALLVASDKTIVGQGSAGVIRGKGLRLGRVQNVIIQNIKITEVNPQKVWGGDGIDIAGVERLWIDHVTIKEIGRQLMVAHEAPNRDITVSNVHFDGASRYSSYCNGRSYWIAKFSGPKDTITLSNNYFSDFMGRAPQVGGEGGTTLIHVVNNLWQGSAEADKAHAFEVLKGGTVLAEGNFLANVPSVVDQSHGFDSLLAVSNADKAAACAKALGRTCAVNVVSGSPAFDFNTGNVLHDGEWGSLPSVPLAKQAHAMLDLANRVGFGVI